MKKTRWGLFLILVLVLAVSLAACDSDDPDDVTVETEGEVREELEAAGEELEDAAEDVGDAAENVGDAVEDAVDDTADAVDDAADDAADAVDDAADAAADTAADIGAAADDAVDDAADAVGDAADDVADAVDDIDLPDVDLPDIDIDMEEDHLDIDIYPGSITFDDDSADDNRWAVVDDQFVANGQLTLSSVTVDEPGWAVVYADDNGHPGPVLGYVRVDADTTENVVVDLENPADSTGMLWLMLHEDTGETDLFEFGDVDDADLPVMIDDDLAVVRFWAEPHMRVQPQILVYGTNPPVTAEVTGPVTLTIRSVLAETPGWVVVHADENDSAGQMLGYAPVDAGLNTDVMVELDAAAVTPTVWLMLHEDTGESGVFEFGEVDDTDGPVTLDGDPVTFLVPVAPAISSVATWQDDDTLLLNWALIDQPGWLVIHQDNEGEAGEVIGYVSLQAGLNTYLLIDVDADNITDTLVAMLHYDTGETDTFEFGDVEDTDVPVMVNGAPVVRELNPTK